MEEITEEAVDLKRTFLQNLAEMDDAELYNYRIGIVRMFNEHPLDCWLSGDRRLSYLAGVNRISGWLEEYIADNRDLEEMEQAFSDWVDEEGCICNECRREMED